MLQATHKEVGREKASISQLAIALCLAICIVAMVFLQGGFFSLAPCAWGVFLTAFAAVLWLLPSCRKKAITPASLMLLGVAVAYWLSAMVNGASLTTLSETGAWAACAGVSFLASAQEQSYRGRVLNALAWSGILMAVLAACVFVGVLSLTGGMVNGRLEFVFQYANAAAVWFGACVLLCVLGPSERLRSYAALPVAAMLLTQSAGALTAFLLVTILAGMWLGRKGAWDLLLEALAQGVLGTLLFAVTVAISSPVGLLAWAAVGAACYWLDRHAQTVVSRVDTRKAILVLAVLLAVALVAAVLAFPIRVQTAQRGLADRLWQMRDALALWMSRPLLGVGPDNWKYLYPYIQTAPYSVTVIHGSFAQILTDAGVLGLGCLVGACVFGIRSLILRCKSQMGTNALATSAGQDPWARAELAVVTLLLIHSIVDFDLQFGSLAFLLAFLLSGPYAQKHPIPFARGLVRGIAVAVVCAPLCLVGLYCSTTSTLLARANTAKDYGNTERLFWSNPFALIDPSAQSEYVTALFGEGNMREVTKTYEQMVAPSNSSVLCATTAWHALGKEDQAATILIERLKTTPYNEALVKAASAYARRYGIDPSHRQMFDEALGEAENRLSAPNPQRDGADIKAG